MNTDIECNKSPTWIEESVVYQIFPDRFRRGKKLKAKNNFMNQNEEPNFYGFFGGDLYGIIDSLEYLENMGITCISLIAKQKSSSVFNSTIFNSNGKSL